MKSLSCVLTFGIFLFAQIAQAHEYPLQFTPASGYRGLVVAGYSFAGNTVVGNCSYYTVHSGSGRGGGYHTTTTHYNQTCSWDFYGNLLSITPGAPAVPAPVAIKGTETLYASAARGEYTGTDTKYPYGGFVNTPGSHYSWETSNAYMVLPFARYTFTAWLKSDGDVPLHISNIGATASQGKVSVNKTNCIGSIPAWSACSVTVTYDPTQLSSPSGLAYDTLTIAVTSDAGQAYNFVQGYTVIVPLPVDN